MAEKEPVRGRGQAFNYDIELEDGLTKYETALNEAYEEVEKAGITLTRDPPQWQRAVYDGRLPADYSGYDMPELSTLLGVVTEWADYTGHLLKMAQNEKITASEQLDLAKARVRKTKDGSKEDRDNDVIIDQRYVDSNRRLLRARAAFELYEGADSAAKRDYAAVSRAITALQTQIERQGRTGSVQRAGERPRVPRPQHRQR